MNALRSLSAFGFFVCSMVWFSGAATIAQQQTAFDRAQALFNARDYKGAIALIDPYLQAHPNDARALVLRGDARASLDDDIGALRDYDAAIVANPDYQYAYATRCDTRRNESQLDGALEDCNRAIALDGTDPLAYEYRGNVRFDQNQYAEAVSDYDRAIQLGRETADVYAERCNAERLADQLERAPADCERALTIDPQDRWGHWARGRLLLTENHYAGGIADLTIYINQEPKGSDNAYYYRGYAYNRTGNFKFALADEQTYIDRHADDADAHAERAIARYNLNDKEGAMADFAIALKGYHEAGQSDDEARVSAWIATAKAGGALP
jgi:tetratricopeptide (TPR) repeat protein